LSSPPIGGLRFVRLFELSPDLSRFMLFVSEARVIQGIAQASPRHTQRCGGVSATAPTVSWSAVGSGGASKGGDGTAELRYLETRSC
jgi:hypothetical protein